MPVLRVKDPMQEVQAPASQGRALAMTDSETIRISFTCAHCGSTNELTATHVHEATVIHCSRCGASVAPLGRLTKRPEREHPGELVEA